MNIQHWKQKYECMNVKQCCTYILTTDPWFIFPNILGSFGSCTSNGNHVQVLSLQQATSRCSLGSAVFGPSRWTPPVVALHTSFVWDLERKFRREEICEWRWRFMIYRLQQIDLDTMKVILYVYMHYNIYLYLLYIKDSHIMLRKKKLWSSPSWQNWMMLATVWYQRFGSLESLVETEKSPLRNGKRSIECTKTNVHISICRLHTGESLFFKSQSLEFSFHVVSLTDQ